MGSYVGAPYNFVPITKNIYKKYQKEEALPRHDKIDTERYSGELQCKITALTDIFIGGGDEVKKGEYARFAHCIDGTPCIPGSSLKGLVRSNMQTLGFGAIAGDVENYSIMYRQVGVAKSNVAKYYKDTILSVGTINLGGQNDKEIIAPRNVKAGYMKKEGESYLIYPTVEDDIYQGKSKKRNYYSVSEIEVFRAKENAEKRGRANPFSFFEELNIQMQHENDSKSKDFRTYYKNNRKHVKGRESEKYIPYMAKILYQLKDNYKVVSIIKYSDVHKEGYQEGYVISTGKMGEKKVFYVIPKCRDEDCIKVPESDILSFMHDYQNKKNKLHGDLKDSNLQNKCRDFFALPKEGEIKPMFYAVVDGRKYFGYTPYLRIFYKHSILRGIDEKQREYMKENGDLKEPVFDYPSAILGYATDDSSYKSRVNFEDFRLQVPNNKNMDQYIKEQQYGVEIVQGEPKLSSYWDYLVQDHGKNAVTYNEEEFELRGIKQYWLHETAQIDKDGKVKNVNAASRFQPFKKEVSFQGKVRFQNLSADELGLLIWSLSLEADSNQNIGRAKAFGFGRIDLELEHLYVYDYDKMYHGTSLCMNVFKEKTAEEINHFIMEYKVYMNRNYKKTNGKPNDIMKEKSVDALLKMKNKKNIPPKDRIEYMSLKDYQNRNQPLHTVDQVIEGGVPEKVMEKNGKNSRRSHTYNDPEGESAPTLGALLANIKLD